MIQCPNCGNLNYEGNKFCGKCGARLPNPKICPECKYQSFIDDFCTRCGTKLISQSDFDKIQKLMDEAFDLCHLDEKYNQAILKYNMVLQIYPNHIEALEGKGDCFYRLHKYDEAINCFDKILDIDSNNYSAWDYKGNCLDHQYKYDKAIYCYNKALNINPDNQSALKSKAWTLLSMGKYDEIPDILSRIKPEREYQWNSLSVLYLKINDFDNALKCLDNIEEGRWNDLAYRRKSIIFQQLGKYDFIMQKCDEKLKKYSNSQLALKIKADCLNSLKKYDEAIEIFDKLIEMDSNDYSAIFGKLRILLNFKKYDEIKICLSKIKPENGYYGSLSELYLEIKEFDESLKCLNKYIESSDYFSSLVVDIYLKLDKPQLAFDYIHKALKNNPNDYYVLCSKGDYYEFLGKFDKSLEVYNKLISINKYNTMAYFKKIDLLLKLEKYPEAKSVLFNIKHSNSYHHWHQISKYYVQLNDYENALKYIDNAIKLNYNIEYLVKKAEILYELKRYDEAMEVCKEASKLNSEYDKLIEITKKISNSN